MKLFLATIMNVADLAAWRGKIGVFEEGWKTGTSARSAPLTKTFHLRLHKNLVNKK
jgi:hypothetical protein